MFLEQPDKFVCKHIVYTLLIGLLYGFVKIKLQTTIS